MVQVQRSKMLEIDGRASSQQEEADFTKDEATKVKSVLDQALKNLGVRQSQENDASSQESSMPEEDYGVEDSEAEEIAPGRRSPISDGSSDKIPVKQSPPMKQNRTMINNIVSEAAQAD